ncbi:ABC transporter permease [Carnobacterium gallinarum]|uniref:ABC transporter permease n=1 Tax=Carnobacterium gallinarum TaxID=2749 RepID=UPI0005507767|nr:ABC transporter permease [Carnobacterium gallinarum]
MKTIYFDELKRELLSIKALIITVILIGTAFIAGKYSTTLDLISSDGGSSPLIDILFGIYGFFGLMFSFLIFSGIVARDVDSQSMRYITPYLSRTKIFFAKYFSMLTYFVLILFLSLVILFLTRGEIIFPVQSLVNITLFFSYSEALVLFFSVLFNKERMVSLTGMIISIAFPILGAWSTISSNYILKIISWVLPYRYVDAKLDIIILVFLTVLILLFGLFIFLRKEI